jgi:hypothetical protein
LVTANGGSGGGSGEGRVIEDATTCVTLVRFVSPSATSCANMLPSVTAASNALAIVDPWLIFTNDTRYETFTAICVSKGSHQQQKNAFVSHHI